MSGASAQGGGGRLVGHDVGAHLGLFTLAVWRRLRGRDDEGGVALRECPDNDGHNVDTIDGLVLPTSYVRDVRERQSRPRAANSSFSSPIFIACAATSSGSVAISSASCAS